jgi:hypothetical protein
MADDDWYKPHRPLQSLRQPKPGELLFEFYGERDHSRWLCELRDLGEPYGIEIQFLLNKALLFARRFEQGMDPTRTPRQMAIAWAEEERKHLEDGGCGRCQGAGWICE